MLLGQGSPFTFLLIKERHVLLHSNYKKNNMKYKVSYFSPVKGHLDKIDSTPANS